MSIDPPDPEMDTIRTELSVAVLLVDTYTGQPTTAPKRTLRRRPPGRPRGPPSPRERYRKADPRLSRVQDPEAVQVAIHDVDASPVLNPSGYLLFLDVDLPENPVLEVSGGTRYLDEEIPFDPSESVVRVDLRPSPTYPFPPSETLLRGRVFDDTGGSDDELAPDEGVSIGLEELDRTTETNEEGWFVLHFGPLTRDDVVEDQEGRIVQVAGKDPLIRVGDRASPRIISFKIYEGEEYCFEFKHEDGNSLKYRECGVSEWSIVPTE